MRQVADGPMDAIRVLWTTRDWLRLDMVFAGYKKFARSARSQVGSGRSAAPLSRNDLSWMTQAKEDVDVGKQHSVARGSPAGEGDEEERILDHGHARARRVWLPRELGIAAGKKQSWGALRQAGMSEVER